MFNLFFRSPTLLPLFSASSQEEYEFFASKFAHEWVDEEVTILSSNPDLNSFRVHGYCIPCAKKVGFIVDMKYGGVIIDGIRSPNWRERLECPFCKMNNRQRLMASIIKSRLKENPKLKIYLMEQVTPIYKWVFNNANAAHITGSEYLGYEFKGGVLVDGIRHEDVENLSFPSSSFDLIISNDVFEHLPNPKIGFKECYRVLKSGGVMLATIPFTVENRSLSLSRAVFINQQLVHKYEPKFHENPLKSEGSLVFTDYGWDLLTMLKEIGFSTSRANVYRSLKFGHIGEGQLIFEFIK